MLFCIWLVKSVLFKIVLDGLVGFVPASIGRFFDYFFFGSVYNGV